MFNFSTISFVARLPILNTLEIILAEVIRPVELVTELMIFFICLIQVKGIPESALEICGNNRCSMGFHLEV